MTWRRLLVLLLTATALAAEARAGIIFGRKKDPPPDPVKRVPELIGIAKTSPDASKRADAVEELREYDVQKFPDIVPVLIHVLMHDPKSSVRAEAAQSIGLIRPISLAGGRALERALDKDSSMRVRLQSRSALLRYNLNGYGSLKKDVPPQTQEPPLAPPLPGAPPGQSAPPAIGQPGTVQEPALNLSPPPAPGAAQPLPVGPTEAPKPQPAPKPVKEKGPPLGPAPY